MSHPTPTCILSALSGDGFPLILVLCGASTSGTVSLLTFPPGVVGDFLSLYGCEQQAQLLRPTLRTSALGKCPAAMKEEFAVGMGVGAFVTEEKVRKCRKIEREPTTPTRGLPQ